MPRTHLTIDECVALSRYHTQALGGSLWSETLAEAERVKPRSLYIDEAIQCALESRWVDALATNHALIERYGPDEDTFNRIGKALTELGRPREALNAYGDTLKLNPLNTIAQKNIRKLSSMVEGTQQVASASQGAIEVDLFSEEPGKSTLTVLTAPSQEVAAAVVPGDVVELSEQSGQLVARTGRGVVLGDIDVKIARRLIPLMASGNRYSAAVARVEDDRIEVIVREVFQSAANARIASFPLSRGSRRDDFRPYAKESLITRGREVETFDPEDEDAATVDSDDAASQEPLTAESEFDEEAPLEAADEEEPDEDLRPEDEY